MKISLNVKYFLALLIGFFSIQLGFSQSYNVSAYQKINELNGGFNGDLDDVDNWGISIDNIGDLDGNGYNDLAVGAYTDDDGGNNRGAVWILFLDENDMVISQTKISDTSGNFLGILDDDDRFGGAVAYLGDMNNDGLIELAVGADYDGDGGFWHGAVWILSLNSDGTVSSHAKISDTQGNFQGFLDDYSIFGTDIENIGDLNGDGIEDLVVGSRRLGGLGISKGAIWVLFMNADFTVNSHQKIGHNEGGFTTLDNEDYFGGSVANIGDLNGDGVVDLAVGAYRDDDLLVNSGSFYVLFLNTDGTVDSFQKVSNLDGGLVSEISNDALFGESIDGVTDIDSDGKIEIVVGALRQNNSLLNFQTGAFFIIELNADGTVSEEHIYTYGENCFSGQLSNLDYFGGSVTFLNQQADNISIAVGSYKDDENGTDKGAIWILNLGELNYSISNINHTSCGLMNGSFTISGLDFNSNYTISYEFNSTMFDLDLLSDSSGEILISGLDAGIYDNISVTNDLDSCTQNLGSVIINPSEFEVSITISSPSICGGMDGNILLSGLNPNSNHTIDYEFNSEIVSINLVSDSNGEIEIDDLQAGTYNNFAITEVSTSCYEFLDQIFIQEPDFILTFNTYQISFKGLFSVQDSPTKG